MTDDFSPIEYSWVWDGANGSPRIRFSIDAMGPHTGTARDPFNQAKTVDLSRQLRTILPDSDWQWFDHFCQALLPKANEVNPCQSSTGMECGQQSSVFLGFELEEHSTTAKAYFLPLEARPLKTSGIIEAIESLPLENRDLSAFCKLVSFANTDPVGRQLKVDMFAIDCLAESERLKIYFRSSSTSFDTVCAVLTMNGALHSSNMASGLEELRELWWLIFGLDENFTSSQELPRSDHRTSGVFFNFDTKPAKRTTGQNALDARPEPKVYMPVKQYTPSDQQAAQGLARFLQKRGRDKYIKNYMESLGVLCAHRPLESGRGLHTYISCALKGGSLTITSYLSPEIYHPARWSV